MLDRNGSGGINLNDLGDVMRALGARMSQTDVEEMFDAVDTNGQKVITYEGKFQVIDFFMSHAYGDNFTCKIPTQRSTLLN